MVWEKYNGRNLIRNKRGDTIVKKIFEFLCAGGIVTLGIILAYIICYAITGLVFWGLGSFIIWVFKIPFSWTYLHGIATAIIVGVLKSIFRKQINIHTN